MIFLSAMLPVAVVLIAVYLMLRYFSTQNEKQFDFLKANLDLTKLKLENERKKDREKVLIPLRLQAYERMVLFLERINPPNLLIREMQPGFNVGQFQGSILSAIRDEYEHNMSQQLYLSEKAWELVKSAKEKVVQVVNTSALEFKPEDEAIKLANKVLSSGFEGGKDPIEQAINAIKEEIRKNY
jgi:nitrogen fixation-related uncharacterized protein